VTSAAGVKDPIRERPGALVPPRIAKLKAERGPFRSDNDLLLAAYYSASQLDPLYARRERLPAEAPRMTAAESLKAMLAQSRPSARGRIGIKSAGLTFQGTV
jgi:hypothetical protein